MRVLTIQQASGRLPGGESVCVSESVSYLVEVVERLVQVGQHSRGGFVGDLDRRLQDPPGDDVRVGRGRRLGRDVHPVVLVAAFAVRLQLLLQCREPVFHKVNVLWEDQC